MARQYLQLHHGHDNTYWREGLGDRLGWKYTVRPECRHTSDWFMIACLCAFIGNTNRNPVVQLKEMENSGICW